MRVSSIAGICLQPRGQFCVLVEEKHCKKLVCERQRDVGTGAHMRCDHSVLSKMHACMHDMLVKGAHLLMRA